MASSERRPHHHATSPRVCVQGLWSLPSFSVPVLLSFSPSFTKARSVRPRGCFRRCAALRFGRRLPGPLRERAARPPKLDSAGLDGRSSNWDSSASITTCRRALLRHYSFRTFSNQVSCVRLRVALPAAASMLLGQSELCRPVTAGLRAMRHIPQMQARSSSHPHPCPSSSAGRPLDESRPCKMKVYTSNRPAALSGL